MRKSKYLNQTYGNWTCTHVYLAANYAHSTRHNAYRYVLNRITSDGVCNKIISVSGPTMKKIAEGKILAEEVARYKKRSSKQINETLYKFR